MLLSAVTSTFVQPESVVGSTANQNVQRKIDSNPSYLCSTFVHDLSHMGIWFPGEYAGYHLSRFCNTASLQLVSNSLNSLFQPPRYALGAAKK
jgi:hypothetical protein